jgi:hypothetical protein
MNYKTLIFILNHKMMLCFIVIFRLIFNLLQELIMKRLGILLVFSLMVLYLVGCATSKFTQTGEIYPPYKGVVKVLTEPPKNKKYTEVGWVASSGGMIHEWTDLIEAMQMKAASKGANAIILKQADKNTGSMVTYNPQFGLIGGSGTQKSLMAIAIRILE